MKPSGWSVGYNNYPTPYKYKNKMSNKIDEPIKVKFNLWKFIKQLFGASYN